MNISIAWRTTCACLSSNMGKLMLFIYLAAASIAAIVYWPSFDAEAAKEFVIWVGFPTFFWWAFVSSRAIKILRDADKLLLPAPMQAISSAFFLQIILTIIIPSILCALLGSNFVYAITTLTAVAAGGLLLSLLPRYWAILMIFIPSFFIGILAEYMIIPATGTNDYLIFLSVLAACMVALALWRFYRLRYFDGDIHSWRSPMALLPDGANGWGVANGTKLDPGELPTSVVHLEPAVQRADTNSPKLALRTYLGLPFMPLTRRSQYKQFFLPGFVYLLFLLFYGTYIFKDANNDIPRDTILAAGLISLLGLDFTFSAALMRLQGLYSKDNAELAELALLPGWKNVQNARSVLLTVITQHIGWALLLPVSVTFIAVSLIPSESNSGYFLVALLIITSILLAVGYGLNIISGQKRRSWLLGFVCVSLFIFYLIQLALFSLKSQESANQWFGMLGWIAFLLFAILYFTFAWRSFQNREHPFLRN